MLRPNPPPTPPHNPEPLIVVVFLEKPDPARATHFNVLGGGGRPSPVETRRPSGPKEPRVLLLVNIIIYCVMLFHLKYADQIPNFRIVEIVENIMRCYN